MRYILLICAAETGENGTAHLDTAQAPGTPPCWTDWDEQMKGLGIPHDGVQLRPAGAATTVCVRDDQLLIADGPFAETKEQIAGYEVIECGDLDLAIQAAASHPVASMGLIEIRPIVAP